MRFSLASSQYGSGAKYSITLVDDVADAVNRLRQGSHTPIGCISCKKSGFMVVVVHAQSFDFWRFAHKSFCCNTIDQFSRI